MDNVGGGKAVAVAASMAGASAALCCLLQHGGDRKEVLPAHRTPQMDTLRVDTLRVMTFNIRLDYAGDKLRTGRDRQWASRRAVAFKTITAQRPDLLGLQEVMPNQLREIRAELEAAGYLCFHVFRDKEEADEACVACIRADRFEELESGRFWLAVDTPDEAGSMAPGAKFARVAIWQRLRERRLGGRELLFIVTHLDHPTTEQAVSPAAAAAAIAAAVCRANLKSRPRKKPVSIRHDHQPFSLLLCRNETGWHRRSRSAILCRSHGGRRCQRW